MEKTEKNKKINTLQDILDALDKEASEGVDGVIVEINPITNTLFFGNENEGLYDEKDGYGVTVQLNNDTKTEFSMWFNKPKATGLSQSNLGLFNKRYGKAPTVGMTVRCKIDENGFYRIEL